MCRLIGMFIPKLGLKAVILMRSGKPWVPLFSYFYLESKKEIEFCRAWKLIDDLRL